MREAVSALLGVCGAVIVLWSNFVDLRMGDHNVVPTTDPRRTRTDITLLIGGALFLISSALMGQGVSFCLAAFIVLAASTIALTRIWLRQVEKEAVEEEKNDT